MFSINIKKQQLHTFVAASIAALAFSLTPSLLAEEGGTGHVAPGGVATLIDTAPSKHGWVIEAMYINYQGSNTREIPIANKLSFGLDASVDILNVGALYTFEDNLLGAHYSVGAFLPYSWMTLDGTIDLGGGPISIRDTAQGIGDMTIIPAMLAWKKGNLEYVASLSIYAPTGDYSTDNLANTGLNYWTVDPTAGVAYANAETGLNAAFYTGITINSENSATNYKSGSMLHFEGSVQQLLPLGPGFFGIGAEAFFFQQVSGDSGSGAKVGDFKGRTAGIGPVVNYILPCGDATWVFEAKWLPEIDTKSRLKGDYVWVKAVYQF